MTIVNSFLFFNEILQLEIRLNELYDVVDFFLINESTTTHSGKPKPLFYNENKDKFKKFHSKIIHHVIDDTPGSVAQLNSMNIKNELDQIAVDKVNRADWFDKSREDYIRITAESEFAIRAMGGFDNNTILVLDEADEIPKASAIAWLRENFDPNEVYNLQGPMFYYYFNLFRADESPWKTSTVCSFETFKTLGLCENRMRRRGLTLDDSSWHFSYMGGSSSVEYKIQSHAEQTLNRPDILNNVKNKIDNALTAGTDIYNRPAKFDVLIVDEYFPKYLTENMDKFKEYIKPY